MTEKVSIFIVDLPCTFYSLCPHGKSLSYILYKSNLYIFSFLLMRIKMIEITGPMHRIILS